MDTVQINRAPVLTLWVVIVAQRLGFKRDEALTIGKAVAGQTAHSKGTRLGIFEPTPNAIKEARAARREKAGVTYLSFMGRELPMLNTDDGLRAMNADKPIKPESVEKYFENKFGESLEDVTCNSVLKLHRARKGGAPVVPFLSVSFERWRIFRNEWIDCQDGVLAAIPSAYRVFTASACTARQSNRRPRRCGTNQSNAMRTIATCHRAGMVCSTSHRSPAASPVPGDARALTMNSPGMLAR